MPRDSSTKDSLTFVMTNPNIGKIYITGATGFIGQHVTKHAIDKQYSVVALVRDVNRAALVLPQSNNLTLVKCDMSEINHFAKYRPNDVLLHCAWDNLDDVTSIIHIEKTLVNHYNFLKSVVLGGMKKIVVTGTFSEYGLQYGPVCASALTNPNTSYGIAKDSLHKFLRQLQLANSFELVWLRLFYSYSFRNNLRGIFFALEKALANGDKSFDMSSGEQLVDYLEIKTVADCIGRSILFKDGIYNVCSGIPIALKDLVEQWLKVNGDQIQLNLGAKPQRRFESPAIWGSESFIHNDAKV
jgi:nucleoside-diphosphate-sugar epimerase